MSTVRPGYPRVNDTKQWVETGELDGPLMFGHLDFETRIRLAAPGEKPSRVNEGVAVRIDRDASIAANKEAIRNGETLLGKVIDSVDVARHAFMRVIGR